MSAQIKLINICTGKYFYDVGKNQIVKITDEEYKYLLFYKNMESNSFFERFHDNKIIINIIKNYLDKGFLSEKKPDRIIHPYSFIIEDLLSKKVHMAILQITQMCNLKCRYCPYSGNGFLDRKHLNKTMSFEIAKKSIDFIFENGLFSDEFNIGFYGGEPLLHFKLIKDIVEYAKQKSDGKQISFFITTNGTFLNKEIIEFLSVNNFSITLSLDGPASIHDKNRRMAVNGNGTFSTIYKSLEIIKNEFPDLVKNIGINAVWDMEESYNTIMNFFNNDTILKHFDYAVSPVDNDIIDMSFSMANNNFYEQQFCQMLSMLDKIGLIALDENIHDKSSLKLIDDFEKALVPQIETPDECHFGGMCVPGYNRLFIDTDGTLLPCEKVSANSDIAIIGNVFSGFDYKKIKKIMNVGALTPNECKECWCSQFCTCCFKFVDDLHSMSREKKLHECKQIKYSVFKTMTEYIILKEAQRLLDFGGK